MKANKIKNGFILVCILLIFLVPINILGVEGKTLQVVSKDKVWSINFNEPILLDEVTKENAFILDDKGEKVDINLELDEGEKILLIKPPSQGYEAGKTYLLQVTERVHNLNSENAMQPISFQFTIETPVYIVKSNNINLSIKQGQAYTLQRN